MTEAYLLKLSAVVVSVALGAAILARDHALPANRLIASVLLCNAWWATSELLTLHPETDAEIALTLYRLMCAGWMPIGVLCMHASLALSANEDHPIALLLPVFYGGLALLLPAAMSTDLVLESIEPVAYGWRPSFGPGFPLAYLLMATPLVCMLACWRGTMSMAASHGELELARVVFFGIWGALGVGTVTAVVFPIFGLPAFGITTNLVSLIGVRAAVTLRRYGHSLIAPEAFAREMLDTLEDGVVLVGAGGEVRDANQAFLRLVDAGEREVLGLCADDFVPGLRDPSAGSGRSSLVEVQARSGERIPVLASSPVTCFEAGRPIGRAYVLRDRREVLSLQRKVVVAARLALVGDLSRSISRAIREPVERTRRELEALAQEWPAWIADLEGAGTQLDVGGAAGEGVELVAECTEGIDRISSIVLEVGCFAPDHSDEERNLHALSEIVDQALRIASVQAPHRIHIEPRLDPDVRVLCHRAQLERVATNLLVNAIQALSGEEVGRPSLAVSVARQGERALLHVEDNGCGIPPELVDRIFDPFFTTKPVGKGTGLGLAISYHIVRDHGGEIRVSSVPGRGTSITVELPRAASAG